MSGLPDFLSKIVPRSQAPARMARLPGPVVFTNGVFDVLHRGHVTYLAQARALGGSLVVALNTDASARRLGKEKYHAPELSTQILLKEDLPVHLRSLATPVDPFADRFDSLQRRSIIEARPAPGERRKPTKQKQMNYKPKKYYNEWEG